jgi:N-carbamoyl-L-amino-acid hydrolase
VTAISINGDRLLQRLQTLGQIGRGADGALARLAATDADKAGRDQLVAWLRAARLDVHIDGIGNIFGVLSPDGADFTDAIMLGSHIDTVIDAGIYDGCYGVLAGLEVIQTLQEQGQVPRRTLAVAAFTNEEGVRFAPDMLGSLVHVGGLSLADAHATPGTDGAHLGDELARIGYAGAAPTGALRPRHYLELHIEQGPVLVHEGFRIGAVENLQGISWQRVTIHGQANHAGTTPMRLRSDAGLAAAYAVTHMHGHIARGNAPTVFTVGTMRLEPNAINVIPARASFTVDLRDPDEARLQEAEAELATCLTSLSTAHGVRIDVERLARFKPVTFDADLVALVAEEAAARGLSWRRMTSGAGHDAQMLARICRAAMIFVPSIDGISHNPRERTAEPDLIAGANVLLGVVTKLLAQ